MLLNKYASSPRHLLHPRELPGGVYDGALHVCGDVDGVVHEAVELLAGVPAPALVSEFFVLDPDSQFIFVCSKIIARRSGHMFQSLIAFFRFFFLPSLMLYSSTFTNKFHSSVRKNAYTLSSVGGCGVGVESMILKIMCYIYFKKNLMNPHFL